jgi:uncharacterized protein
MSNPKFEIFKSTASKQSYFRLKAANGKIILSSEGYIANQSCRNGITSVKVNAPVESRYERKDATNNYSFNLKAANGEIIGRSESYTSSAGRESGIAAVKEDAPDAPIEDLG